MGHVNIKNHIFFCFDAQKIFLDCRALLLLNDGHCRPVLHKEGDLKLTRSTKDFIHILNSTYDYDFHSNPSGDIVQPLKKLLSFACPSCPA